DPLSIDIMNQFGHSDGERPTHSHSAYRKTEDAYREPARVPDIDEPILHIRNNASDTAPLLSRFSHSLSIIVYDTLLPRISLYHAISACALWRAHRPGS